MKDAALVSAVFDCNVYLQAASREKSVAAECLRAVEKGSVTLYLSEDVLTEVEDVLMRPEVRNHFQDLTDEIVEAFILKLRKSARIIGQVPKRFSYSRDPDDEPYINLAIEAKADYIVSRDKDLLDLMIGYTDECKDFRQRFRPLKAVEPLEFLKELRNLQTKVGIEETSN